MPSPSRLFSIAAALALPALGVFTGLRFLNRQPERLIPPGDDNIVSPADGVVIHIQRTASSFLSFFKKDVRNILEMVAMEPPYKVVVIELNLLNVHVQRAPIAGQVLAQRYYFGAFANVLSTPGKEKLINTNEKLLTVIGNGRTTVGVVQVAGLVARRILNYTKEGALLTKGQPLGLITFGSQVVVVVPDQALLQVRIGDHVTDGETVIASL